MKPTREGKRFLIATVLISVASLNTGNNLIYLILSLMLSFLMLSFLIFKVNLSGLSAEVSVIPPVYAKEEVYGIVTLKNRKRMLTSYSLHLEATGLVSTAYFPAVSSGSEEKKEVKMRYEKRGLVKYPEVTAATGFPFILFNGRKQLGSSGGVLVYPALFTVDQIIPDSRGETGTGAVFLTGMGDDIASLRDFHFGDDLRKVHWKASAKTSSLMVKEYAEQETFMTTLILDNLGHGDPELFEKTVSLTASLASHFISQGHMVRMLSCRTVIPFGGGEPHIFSILEALAVIREEDQWENPPAFDHSGFFVAVLRSPASALAGYATQCDLVVYA